MRDIVLKHARYKEVVLAQPDGEALVKALEDVKLTEEEEVLEEYLVEHAPDTLRCPISLELFKHPVVAMDSHTHEEAALVAWIEKCKSKGQPVVSPKTNAPMAEGMIFVQGFKCWSM